MSPFKEIELLKAEVEQLTAQNITITNMLEGGNELITTNQAYADDTIKLKDADLRRVRLELDLSDKRVIALSAEVEELKGRLGE